MSKILIDKLNNSLSSLELFNIVDTSYSPTQVLIKLGYCSKGQYIKIVRDFLLKENIDISHFTINGKPKVVRDNTICPVCKKEFKQKESKRRTTCSYSCSNTFFRSGKDNPNYKNGEFTDYRLHALLEYGEKCQKCGYDKNISALTVHHIDKNRNNNSISNLMVLCANCHAIEHWGK